MNQTMIPFCFRYFVVEGWDADKEMTVYRVFRQWQDADNLRREWLFARVEMSNILMYDVDQWFIYEENGLHLNENEYLKYRDMRANDLEIAYWDNLNG
jgi:hypothetical protein